MKRSTDPLCMCMNLLVQLALSQFSAVNHEFLDGMPYMFRNEFVLSLYFVPTFD